MNPLISIGLPTYRRKESLVRAIQVLLNQTFTDFEIVVGNDDPYGPLDSKSLGISDPRLRIINHEVNLGEVGNMNAVLKESRGKYFTWQFDDDLVHPEFLQRMVKMIHEKSGLKVYFSAYCEIYKDEIPEVELQGVEPAFLSGREFVHRYFKKTLRVMGCTGLYEIDYLRDRGGMPKLCEAKSAIYGEYLLLVRCGLLDGVGFLDLPLVYFRVHESSWTAIHGKSEMFEEAGLDLLKKSVILLSEDPLRKDFEDDFRGILQLCHGGFLGRSYQNGQPFPVRKMLNYLQRLQNKTNLSEQDPLFSILRKVIRGEKREMLRLGVIDILKNPLHLFDLWR